jgi:hypothetical protein
MSAPFPRTGLLALLLALVALLLPATALAAVRPDVSTDSAQSVTAAQEIVAGTVNPHGLSTVYHLEYAAAGSSWCADETQGTPTTTMNATLHYTDSVSHIVSVAATGLSGGTSYCAELVAVSVAGTSRGGQMTFTAGLPSVTTSAADPAGVQAGAVQGTVNPASQSTTYFAVYDLASSLWCTSGGLGGSPAHQTTPATLAYQDALAHSVTVNVTGLQAATPYCAAIAASNGSSTTAGGQVLGSPAGFTTDTPVTTDSVQSTSATAAQLMGTVNPDGVSTTYYAVYAQVGSDWCQSGGASGSALPPTVAETLLFQDQSPHSVTVDLTGLTRGMTYCVELQSRDTPLGVSSGVQDIFTAGLPTATSIDVAPDGPSTAVLDGSVGPAGQSATYQVLYDLQNSKWCLSGGTIAPDTPSTADTVPYTTTAQPLAQSDGGTYRVRIDMAGLTPGVQYCAALAAVNPSNGQSGSPPQSVGVQMNFTGGIAPTASTTSVLDVTASTSAESGTINPEGQTATYHIAYDTVDSSWCLSGTGNPADTTVDQTVNPQNSAMATQDQSAPATLTGLQGGQTYCAAVVATNASGSVTAPTVQFVAGMPSATASTVTPVSPTEETLTGTVTPTTQVTSYYAAYDFIGSDWCATGGDLSSPSFTTVPEMPLGVTDNNPHEVPVPVSVTGLTPGAEYCAEMIAHNGSGKAPSSLLVFTAGFPFGVTTSATDHLTASSVTIDGTVNPAGLATSYWATYDTVHSDWCASGGQHGAPRLATDPVSLAASDTADHDVAVAVNGLSPETAYCAEVVAQNDMGTTKGGQVSFTTAVAPVITAPVVPVSLTGAPSAALVNPSATSPTTATVTGTIGPGGQRTIYHAAYGPAGSPFCLSGGANGQPSTTALATLPFIDSNPHTIAVSLSGLKRATRYCAQIIAQNTSGVAVSAVASFITIGGPRLSGLRLAPATFVATKRGATSVAKLPKGQGTRVSYQDTQAGKVVFTVTQQHQGARTTHGACGQRRRSSLELCVYTTIIGRFTGTAAAGANSLVFTGRLGGHKLAHGSYRLEAVAADRWKLSSPTATVRFAIR